MDRAPAKRSQTTHADFADEPFCKVTAIVRTVALENVEQHLKTINVPGISVTKVKGYGEYKNFFRHDWVIEYARIEIFLQRKRADEVVRTIVDAAQTGQPGDGLVAILPVESLYRIRSGEKVQAQ
jgi:nitrogen regulatory protein P-II 1